MTGQQLKNSILQMAVQGKLVPQDPNDEPASVLLERIRAEKEQLIKEGKIKKEKNPSVIFRGADNLPYEKVGKNEPVCIADEVPFDIPESWEWVRFSNIIELQSGQDMTPDKYNSTQLGIPYITGASNIANGNVVINRWTEYGKAFAHRGDLLLTCKGTVGSMAVLKEPQVHIARQLMAIRSLSDDIEISYIKIVLETLIPILKAAAKSMIPGIAREDVLHSLLPLPPTSEQKRICGKIKALLPHIEIYDIKEKTAAQLNSSFPDTLKKSVLQDAVQGKLVLQDSADEPASVLLEHIRAEKEQLIKAGKIKRDKHESVIFRRDNSYYEISGKKEVCIDDEILFDIPESWEWTRLGNVLASTDAGKSPQCEDRSCNKGEAGVIKTTAVQDGYFLPNENKVLPTSFTIQKDQLIRKGDLLITRAGPRNRTGVLCVVDVECEKLILSDKTVRLAYIRNNVNPHYLQIALSSPAIQNMVVKAMSGMAESQVNISQSNMKKFLIPIPPLNEQNRIVDKYKTVYSAFVNKFEFLL
jgi:restriction endonuclease S subunit